MAWKKEYYKSACIKVKGSRVISEESVDIRSGQKFGMRMSERSYGEQEKQLQLQRHSSLNQPLCKIGWALHSHAAPQRDAIQPQREGRLRLRGRGSAPEDGGGVINSQRGTKQNWVNNWLFQEWLLSIPCVEPDPRLNFQWLCRTPTLQGEGVGS